MKGITIQPLDEPEIEVETFIEKTSNDVNPTVHVEEEIIENENPNQILPVKASLNRPSREQDDDNYDDIISSITSTEESLKFIRKAFEKLDFATDDLLEKVVEKLSIKKANQIQKENPTLYNKGIKYLRQTYPNEPDRRFYEIRFEDIILVICSIVKYFTSLQIKLELGDLPTNLMVIFYANEEQYNNLADHCNYELQLKPYAYKYEYYLNEYEKSKDPKMYIIGNAGGDNLIGENGEDNPLLVNTVQKAGAPIQFENLDFEKPYLWPPYEEFDTGKEDKFRRYETNDLFHECSFDDNGDQSCGKCSKFRNIDKLRLIFDSLDKSLKLTYLKKKGFIITILYKRNYEGYGDKLSLKHLLSYGWPIFNRKNFDYLINLIRNFYGEVISYYFLWMEHYIQWLIFPGILGIIVGIVTYINPFPKEPLGKTPLTYLDIFLLAFCVIITIWAVLFLHIWKQKENIYAYIWGTEDFSLNEPDSELFNPDSEIDFVFGKKITVAASWIRNLKKFVSYLVLLIMVVATCSITFLLFHYKKISLKADTPENYWFNTAVGMGFAALNAIQIKVFNFLYTFLATHLNRWENYKKDYQRLNDLSIKLIIFDFMNCYTACFYIGFYKPAVGEACVGTCIQEIGTQLYTTYLINFALNIVEIGLPFLMYKFRKYNFKAKAKKSNGGQEIGDIKPHSVMHQMLCDEMENTIYEYNEMIISYGYVCLFSITAPFTPAIIFVLVWTEKLVDLVKIFFLERVQILDQATGIQIYNYLLKILMFIGILTNSGLLMFSKELKINNDMVYKIVVFLIVENFIIIMMYTLKWSIRPSWFKELKELKELYDKKFFRRKRKNLPHIYLQALKRKEQMRMRELAESGALQQQLRPEFSPI